MKHFFRALPAWIAAALLAAIAIRLHSQKQAVREQGAPSSTVQTYIDAVCSGDFRKATGLCTKEWAEGLFLTPGGEGPSIRFIDLLPALRDEFLSTGAEVKNIELGGEFRGTRFAKVEIRGKNGLLYLAHLESRHPAGTWIITAFEMPSNTTKGASPRMPGLRE